VNILNKLSQAADKGWSSSFTFGHIVSYLPQKKHDVTKCYEGLKMTCHASVT
jgi:hypothetical protein